MYQVKIKKGLKFGLMYPYSYLKNNELLRFDTAILMSNRVIWSNGNMFSQYDLVGKAFWINKDKWSP